MDMVLFKDPMIKSSREYIENIAKIIDDPRLSDSSLSKIKISKIKKYLNLIKYQLLDQLEANLVVVFSHGDFSLVNILSTARGVRVIDWEGAKLRGLLYDFFNFFLTEIYYRRADVGIADYVNDIAYDFSVGLKQKNNNDISVQFYRRLYYLERVNMLLERELTDKLLEVILRSIDVFQQFERESNLEYQQSVDKECL
jgi:thiamine kinase-like enzyme